MDNIIVAPIGYNKKLLANEKICIVCSKEFRRKGQRKFTAKFCSVKCKAEYQKGKLPSFDFDKKRNGRSKNCIKCNESFYVSLSNDEQRFCSRICHWEYGKPDRQGDKHWNWKGGIKPVNQKLRNSRNYSEWRKKVFARDNYTCQSCSQRGGELEADHIKQFAFYPELRFDITNGRTLCKSCHKKTDTYKNGKKI